MSGAYANCPHCGKLYHKSAMHRHEPCCIANPAVFDATKSELDDGSGQILPKHKYAELRQRGASYKAIFDQIGCSSWEKVASVFGLTFQTRQHGRPQREHNVTIAWDYADEPIQVVGLPVCTVKDYGNCVGYVLR